MAKESNLRGSGREQTDMDEMRSYSEWPRGAGWRAQATKEL